MKLLIINEYKTNQGQTNINVHTNTNGYPPKDQSEKTKREKKVAKRTKTKNIQHKKQVPKYQFQKIKNEKTTCKKTKTEKNKHKRKIPKNQNRKEQN